MLHPGACSPSRKVVSKMRTRSLVACWFIVGLSSGCGCAQRKNPASGVRLAGFSEKALEVSQACPLPRNRWPASRASAARRRPIMAAGRLWIERPVTMKADYAGSGCHVKAGAGIGAAIRGCFRAVVRASLPPGIVMRAKLVANQAVLISSSSNQAGLLESAWCLCTCIWTGGAFDEANL